MIDAARNEPFLNLWFGNFYEPAYGDREAVERTLGEIAELGFYNVIMDSKTWQDFSSPPVLGESVMRLDGSDGNWYKYRSSSVHDVMERHVRGFPSLYREGHSAGRTEDGERLPICSMWAPIVAPGFDVEGRERYRFWLSAAYGGDIARLNAADGTAFADFRELAPAGYWFAAAYGETATFEAADTEEAMNRFRIHADNMRWRDELVSYCRIMKRRLRAVESRFRPAPDLTQWSFFLLVPVTPSGDPDAYVATCQAAMIRAMNTDCEFTVGLFLGRLRYNDEYRQLSPEEVIGSVVASGARRRSRGAPRISRRRNSRKAL